MSGSIKVRTSDTPFSVEATVGGGLFLVARTGEYSGYAILKAPPEAEPGDTVTAEWGGIAMKLTIIGDPVPGHKPREWHVPVEERPRRIN